MHCLQSTIWQGEQIICQFPSLSEQPTPFFISLLLSSSLSKLLWCFPALFQPHGLCSVANNIKSSNHIWLANNTKPFFQKKNVYFAYSKKMKYSPKIMYTLAYKCFLKINEKKMVQAINISIPSENWYDFVWIIDKSMKEVSRPRNKKCSFLTLKLLITMLRVHAVFFNH